MKEPPARDVGVGITGWRQSVGLERTKVSCRVWLRFSDRLVCRIELGAFGEVCSDQALRGRCPNAVRVANMGSLLTRCAAANVGV